MPQFSPSSTIGVSLLAALGLMAIAGQAQEIKKQPVDEVKALIDQLTQVDRQDTGYSGSVSGSSFLPLGESQTGTMLLFQKPNDASEALKSLVKLGTRALPKLLEHLKDDRPTKIVVRHQGGLGGLFIMQDEEEKKKEDKQKGGFGGGFGTVETQYTVMVGDLCFVAIGQIVNRHYAAVSYVPTAIISVTSVPKSKAVREEVVRLWSNLTPEKHRDSLVRDLLETDDEYVRNGASYRLAYYYPAALETAALKQLGRPSYSVMAVYDLVHGPLYAATTAKQRKARSGRLRRQEWRNRREGIRSYLFGDLSTVEADEEGRLSPKMDKRYPTQECLIDAFGLPRTVKSKDKPAAIPLDDSTQARFVQTLHYDRGDKLDQTLRDLLAKTDNDYLAKGCLDGLVGRGYDAAIEAYLKAPLASPEGRRARRTAHLRTQARLDAVACSGGSGRARIRQQID